VPAHLHFRIDLRQLTHGLYSAHATRAATFALVYCVLRHCWTCYPCAVYCWRISRLVLLLLCNPVRKLNRPDVCHLAPVLIGIFIWSLRVFIAAFTRIGFAIIYRD